MLPWVEEACSGSPTTRRRVASTKASTKASATRSSTMKRLAAMQLCPVFWKRAFTPTVAAVATSASASTMKGSEPPSSSTCFFKACPAAAAMERPAGVEPVKVTAAMRRSAISAGTSAAPTSSVGHRPAGTPASAKTCSMASAHCGTLLACLSTRPLPPASTGAAARITCHSG